MVLFFTVALVSSLFGMVLLLVLKHHENTTERVFFASIRPHIGEFFHQCLLWVERILPALVRIYGRRGIRALRAWFHRSIASLILSIEETLEKGLRVLRMTSKPRPGSGKVSRFLQEIAEHKQTLVREEKVAPIVPPVVQE